MRFQEVEEVLKGRTFQPRQAMMAMAMIGILARLGDDMEDSDKTPLTRIGDLLQNALKSSRLHDSVKDKSWERDSLDLVEEMMAAENEMKIRLFSTLERSRDELEQVLMSRIHPQGGLVPFTAGAAKALELAEQAAGDMGHEYVADAHVLVGLTLVEEKPSRALLNELALSRKGLYESVARLEFNAQRSLKELMLSEKTTAFEIVLNARELAGEGDITTLHLLSALVANKRSSAVKVLAQQSVDVDGLRARVEGTRP